MATIYPATPKIKAGLKRAVAQGVKLGRPRIDSATERKVRKQLAKGIGLGASASLVLGPMAFVTRKLTTRTHFVYRIDIWTDDGKHILEHLVGAEKLIVARAAYQAACVRWPNARITLRQGGRVVEDNRRRTKA